MKKIALCAAVLTIAASCSVKEVETATVHAPTMYGYTEEDPASKTELVVGVDGKGKIWWKPSDDINIFFGTTSVKYTSTNTQNATTVVFETNAMIGSTESSTNNKWGLYPYDASATCDDISVTTSIPASQKCVPGTFSSNLFTMIANTQDNNLHFKNVCGGIKFSLSRDDIWRITFKGNNGEDIAGQVKLSFDSEEKPVSDVVTGEKTITLTPQDGGTFAKDANYYLIMLPTVLSQGFTMTFYTASESGTFEYTAKSVEIKRSIFATAADIDSYATFVPLTAKDLSAAGTANCYVVSEYGPCKFDATKKGHTNESVGAIASAEVLWESFGNNVQPTVGDIVSNVSVENGIVNFIASGRDGNAVIAVKDAAGDILWSWHIWVCQGFDPNATAQEYYNNAGIVMDRNLGATSATKGDVKALGLLYQWGRKDPFLGGESISYGSSSGQAKAKSTINWPSRVESDASTGTIDYVIKHPTVFVDWNSNNLDWYYSGSNSTDNSRWNSNKGMYDPCPKGWRVPDGGRNGLWAKALGSTSDLNNGPWDDVNKGMDFTGKFSDASKVWYPASGYLVLGDASLIYVGEIGLNWSCTTFDYYAMYLGIAYDGEIVLTHGSSRAYGRSVRCVKEMEVKDLSADGTANCYVVSEYGPCKFDATKKGHTNESVGAIASAEVLWESFGNDVQPTVGDIVSNVSVENGIVNFTASGRDGNAVIAVKDATGDILWSWHIWVCQGFDPNATAQEYYNNAGIVMDRNLGATSATKGDVKALGLLYQWGRKDPFLSGESISSSVRAKSTITWPYAVEPDAVNGTIDYAVKHPTTFLRANSGNNNDWCNSADNTRWNSAKGMYDPCPKGWRVPDGGSNGLWSKALGSSDNFTDGPWDDANKGMDFTGKFSGASKEWYPASGHIIPGSGTLGGVGYFGYCWTCTPRDGSAYRLSIGYDNFVGPSVDNIRSRGHSVRCVKQ